MPTGIFLAFGIIVIVVGIFIRYMPSKPSVPVAAFPVEKSITEKLEGLDSLRQRALISEEEFETKLKDLLDRM